MTTSGTTAFDMNFTEWAEEAWERAGKEMRSGYQLRTARRSMNLLTIELNNRGLNMWTMEQGSIALVAGTANYELPADTVDLLEHVRRINDGNETTQQDFPLARVSVSTYAAIPNKLLQAPPLQVLINRTETPSVTLWPVPDDSQDYTLVYWRMRRIQDAGTGINTQDVVYRFYPAVIAGLAYYIAMKDPELAPRLPVLKQEYENQLDLATGEDREKASVRWVPRRSYIGGC